MAIHLTYGGSTAARTLQCPAWQRLSVEVPFTHDGGNPAADEGTMLHNCMEKLYDPRTYPNIEFLDELIGEDYQGQVLDDELLERKLRPAADALEDLMDKYDVTEWVVEPFVKISADMGGSIDFLGRSEDEKTVVIVDYKFGFHGVAVENNVQAQFYALAAATDPLTSDWFGDDLETIVVAIIQPNNEGDVCQTWATDLDQIDRFETAYLNAVDLTEDPDSPPKSGPACKYCPAEAVCPVKTGVALQATRINEITADKLAEYLPIAEEVEAWAKAVKKMAHEQLELGTPIRGYKLVAKRASRIWTNLEDVTDKVRRAKKIKLAEGFNSVLKSPAQLEKVCNTLGIDFALHYEPLISKISSGTTMAQEGDKRKAIIPLAGLEQLNSMNGGV